jgi:uncharacterized membrane protein YidH (DUF202 family)
LEASKTISEAQTEASGWLRPGSFRAIPERMQLAIYALAVALSISTWFIAIHAPLWLDETVSFFLIKGGFAGILSRQVWPDSPVYSCLLWLWTKAVGTGEITLRISSILPMLAATYLLYRAARELFDQDVAVIAAIVFCLHPIIIFAAIDVRPYAFSALIINATILVLVHLRHSNSKWLAALFGVLAACIVEFQLLFAVILPALAICFIASKVGERKTLWQQLAVALIAFGFAFLPTIPRLEYMFRTSGTHVFSEAPKLGQLVSTLSLRALALILLAALLFAAKRRWLNLSQLESWPILLCLSLALVPLLTLYGLSVGTSVHVFVSRYRLVAVPGIALCWAFLVSRIGSQALRLLFCLVLVTVAVAHCFSSPAYRHHQYSWKQALGFAEQNASADNAPVLICSDLPESDHMTMPVGSAIEDSGILPPLSYYKLSSPIVALPRALNGEAIRDGSRFIEEAAQRHERFLALAFVESYGTLDWLRNKAAGKFNVSERGAFDGVKVLEFVPRSQEHASR